MYWLFLILKDCHEPPTDAEITLASCKKTLDQTEAAEYLVKLEKALASIVDALLSRTRELQ